VIPRIGVDASIETRGVDENSAMENPTGPWVVAWYVFSSHPALGGNAVFAGCIDWVSVGPAVFHSLPQLGAGDVVEVHLTDGTVLRYRVTSTWQVQDPSGAELATVLGPTSRSSVTLIAPAGVFDPNARRYQGHLVVRAERE
jgi:hypothetical protein